MAPSDELAKENSRLRNQIERLTRDNQSMREQLARTKKSLHDFFMGQALANLADPKKSPTEIARECCRIADAMLRAKGLETGA